MWYAIFTAVLAGYLLGNLNGSVNISMLVSHDDVRDHGSGNAGLTNFFRSYGSWSTLLVMLVDALKTLVACYVAGLIMKPYDLFYEGLMIGALAVSIGHDFPLLLGLRGGKGILCGLAVGFVMDWRIGVIILVIFVIVFAITRYVSLGSVLASLAFSVSFAIFHHDNLFVMIGGVFLGLLAIWMHRTNIKRLIKGTESKVHLIHRDLNK